MAIVTAVVPAACPFCGDDADLHEPYSVDVGEPGHSEFRVNCADCLTYGPSGPTEAAAIFAWNARVDVPVPPAGFANCPFCGSDVQLRIFKELEAPRMVECTSCDAWGGIGEDSAADVRKLWNRRPTSGPASGPGQA